MKNGSQLLRSRSCQGSSRPAMTPLPIEHMGDVPLRHVGQKGIMRNVLHVPTITKNLVSVEQIVDQGMQVRFTHHGYFIEEEG